MKKFISLLAINAIIFSVTSCREVNEIASIPESDFNTITNKKTNSLNLEQKAKSKDSSNVEKDKKDPPPKDKFEW
jgi:hypothetical protein